LYIATPTVDVLVPTRRNVPAPLLSIAELEQAGIGVAEVELPAVIQAEFVELNVGSVHSELAGEDPENDSLVVFEALS
jgi:hypothetical protein